MRPFCRLTLKCAKPKNLNYLWEKDPYLEHPSHIGQHVKKRRFDLKMSAAECQRLLGVDKSTLTRWEQGKHNLSGKVREKIVRFLGYDPAQDNPSG